MHRKVFVNEFHLSGLRQLVFACALCLAQGQEVWLTGKVTLLSPIWMLIFYSVVDASVSFNSRGFTFCVRVQSCDFSELDFRGYMNTQAFHFSPYFQSGS